MLHNKQQFLLSKIGANTAENGARFAKKNATFGKSFQILEDISDLAAANGAQRATWRAAANRCTHPEDLCGGQRSAAAGPRQLADRSRAAAKTEAWDARTEFAVTMQAAIMTTYKGAYHLEEKTRHFIAKRL